MKPCTPVMLLLAAVAASASAAGASVTFDQREAAARALAATPRGLAYDTALVPEVHHAIVPCVPKGTDPRRGGEFDLVATVGRSGRATMIEVRPASPLANCFARGLATMKLQAPPQRTGGWPIVVEMRTRP